VLRVPSFGMSTYVLRSYPYDTCVFNRMYKDKQCTACVQVDDIKITCADPLGVEDTVQGLTNRYKTIIVQED